MRVTVLCKIEYKGYHIYVMHFGFIFQYLFAEEKEIHQQNITLQPPLYRRVLSAFNVMPPYTKDQMDDGERVMLSGAMKSIDKLMEPGARMQRDKERKIEAKRVVPKECQWQTTEGSPGEFFYLCLTHGKAVEMVDDVKPKHD